MRNSLGHCKVYVRYDNIIKEDRYGERYKIWRYKLEREMFTEDYNELLDGCVLI